MKLYHYIVLLCVCLLSFSCSKDTTESEEPQIALYDISGVWSEYAYKCSDGYFVDISDTGYNMYYEFVRPDKFMQYNIDENGNKDIVKQGTWTYNPETKVAHIEEPRGWNLDITFSFIESDDMYYNAILDIKGRTPQSSSIIKAKCIR